MVHTTTGIPCTCLKAIQEQPLLREKNGSCASHSDHNHKLGNTVINTCLQKNATLRTCRTLESNSESWGRGGTWRRSNLCPLAPKAPDENGPTLAWCGSHTYLQPHTASGLVLEAASLISVPCIHGWFSTVGEEISCLDATIQGHL